jgi:hypothetical protein
MKLFSTADDMNPENIIPFIGFDDAAIRLYYDIASVRGFHDQLRNINREALAAYEPTVIARASKAIVMNWQMENTNLMTPTMVMNNILSQAPHLFCIVVANNIDSFRYAGQNMIPVQASRLEGPFEELAIRGIIV